MGTVTERQKGAAMCTNCRSVYSVWIDPEGRIYPISSLNSCSCDECDVRVIDDV